MGNSCARPTPTPAPSTPNNTNRTNGFFESVTASVWRAHPPENSLPPPPTTTDDDNPNQTPVQQSPQEHMTIPPSPPPTAATNTTTDHKPTHVRRTSSMGLQLDSVLGRKTGNLKETYTLGRKLGQGHFGTTFLCVDKSSGQEFACKSIAKRKLTCLAEVEDIRREIRIMHHLSGHPNVINIVGAYEDSVAVHVVMDLCCGGELFDRIIERGHYTERKAAEMARVIVGVVEACHSLGVLHRDLKPENFLLVSQEEDAPLKTIDFGLSVFFKPGNGWDR